MTLQRTLTTFKGENVRFGSLRSGRGFPPLLSRSDLRGPLHQSRAGVLLGSGPLGLSRAKTSPISPYLSRPALIFAKRETAEATIPIPPIKTGIKAHTICEYIPHLR